MKKIEETTSTTQRTNLLAELAEIKRFALLGAKEALTIDEAGLLTGLRKSYLYKLTHQRRIPHYKNGNGGRLYFRKSELNDWLLSVRCATDAELQASTTNSLATKGAKTRRGGVR